MKIVVAAQACRASGALTVYRQFMSYLPKFKGENQWFIFIDPSMDHPEIEGVQYIYESNHSLINRIKWNRKGLEQWLNNKNIDPDCIVSFQNTGVKTNCRQIIYYHQSLPFYRNKWNPFKRSERMMWAYKHIYPYFVNETLNDKTDIVVQIPFIKEGFVKKFKFDPNKVHTLFPDVNLPDNVSENLHDEKKHFIYPAAPLKYKEHATIINALNLLKRRDSKIKDNIIVHFTIKEDDLLSLVNVSEFSNVSDMIRCEGTIPFDEILKRYATYNGLLFPSTIETLGLPLIEAAHYGLPIIVNDIQYAKEVLNEYEGAVYIPHNRPSLWANQIEDLANNPLRYKPLRQNKSSWPEFFKIILGS